MKAKRTKELAGSISHREKKGIRRAFEQGFYDVLLKPVSPAELMQKVQGVLEKRRTRKL